MTGKDENTVISDLVSRITAAPNDVLHRDGDHRAVHTLVNMGESAVRPIIVAMRSPCPPGRHPVDVIEALGSVLAAIAIRTPLR